MDPMSFHRFRGDERCSNVIIIVDRVLNNRWDSVDLASFNGLRGDERYSMTIIFISWVLGG